MDETAEPVARRRIRPIVVLVSCLGSGGWNALVAVLDPDILLHDDTGSGTVVEVRGAENVARRAMVASQLGLVVRRALVNGTPGWVALLDRRVFSIGALTVQNGRITTIDILRDPARLARLDLTGFGSRP